MVTAEGKAAQVELHGTNEDEHRRSMLALDAKKSDIHLRIVCVYINQGS